MKKNALSFSLFIIMSGIVLLFSSSSGGISGKSTQGCGGGGCHTPSTATTMSLTGIPASGYVGGQSYSMTLTVSNATKQGAGFDLTCNLGTILAGTGTQAIGNQELTHSSPLTMNAGNAVWTFTWTAPQSGINPVIFFVAGNAVNLNNNAQSDAFNTDQFSFNAAQTSAQPSISNVGSSNISNNSATINATINANNANTTVSVEYGLTASYGSTMATTPAQVSGQTATAVSATLSGLQAGTTYHYRIVATNTVGTAQSNDFTFQTTTPNALQELPNGASYSLFPNPCKGQLIYQNPAITKECQFKINNLLGQAQAIPQPVKTGESYYINTENLVPGLYQLQVVQGQQQTTHLFNKQ